MNRAQRGLDNVQGRPRDVVDWSLALLDDPTATPEELVTSSWALGRAYAELDQVEHACTSLERSIELATKHGLDQLTADIRISLSTSLVTAGRIVAATEQLDLAEPHLTTDASRGRHAMQRGFVAMHVGDLEESLEHYEVALAHLANGADELARTRSLINRGIANTMTGNMSQGQADFLSGQHLAESLGQHMLAAGTAQNLGFYAGRAGDVPTALRWFARARCLYEELGSPGRVMSLLESDFSTVLLTGGLYAESAAAATHSAEMAAQTGNRLAEAEARLLVARAELAAGNHDRAEHQAVVAAEMFHSTDRQPWAAIAEYVGLQGAALRTAPSRELLERTALIAERLRACGWWREALEAQTLAGRLSVALGRIEEARHHLSDVADRAKGGSATLRTTALLATATLHLADAERPAAKTALVEAMDLVEDHRATLGSTELRAYASISGAEVAELGLRLATEDRDPSEIFEWAERWRAGSLQVAGIKPDPGSALASSLNRLRQAHRSTIEGTTDPFDVDRDRHIAELERDVQRLSREIDTCGRRHQRRSLDDVRRCLGQDILVEYFVVDSCLHAIVASSSGAAVHELGPVAGTAGEVRQLTASLDRRAHRAPPTRSPLLDDAIHATATRLEARLLAGIDVDHESRVVVVPTHPLQMMPWALLPSLSSTSVTVSPSSWLWAEGGHRQNVKRALLVCGPDLPGGQAEVERLAALYEDPVVFGGTNATVANVVGALGEVDIAHIAAHGSLRSDNPMLSGLLLHDGPLTVYDLEALPAAPEIVVLPACNAARSSVYDGDELLGTAAALLQSGVRSIIAPVTVVPDATVVPDLMNELHRHLLAGHRAPEALVAARQVLERGKDRSSTLAARSFVAIGSAQH